MLYRPKLSNGKLVPLNWPIRMLSHWNGICWPLEDHVGIFFKVLDRSYFVFFLLVFAQHNVAQLRSFIVNFNDLDKVLTDLPAYLVQVEMTLCCIFIGLHKQQFKLLLKQFYAKIYVDELSYPQLYRCIQSKMHPTFAFSSTYLLTLTVYVAIPFISLYNQRRDLLYDMNYPFDITPLYLYLPIVFMSIWFSFTTCTMLFSGANVMSEIMLHLHTRYLLLEEELLLSSKQLLQQAERETISRKFHQKVKQVIQRNVELNRFAVEFQDYFSFRIFMIFSFAAVVLCIVAFKIYTNISESIVFVVWMISKIVEMLALGEVSSTLTATTDTVSFMYYNSNWELIILCSTNSRENIELMKLLVTAIETNRKPFTLTGLNFFNVSQTAILNILKGAASYFTCLISFQKVT